MRSPRRPQPPAHEPRLLILGLLALIAFLGLGAIVARSPASEFDHSIAALATSTFESGPARAALDVLNVLGTIEVGAVLTIGLAIVFAAARRPGSSLAILSTWLAELAGAVVKLVLMRERPPGALVESVLGESWAYPSGHVIRTVAVVAVLAWLVRSNPGAGRPATSSRAWRALAVGLVAGFLMGTARLAAGVHWPTDVIGGLLLGTAFACWFAVVAKRLQLRFGSGLSEPSTMSRPPP